MVAGAIIEEDEWFGYATTTLPQEQKNEVAIAFNVKIPAFEIDKYHSEVLIKAIKKETVVLKVDIELPSLKPGKVEVALWYGSIFDLQPQLMLDLAWQEKTLGSHVSFEPKLVTFGCPTCPDFLKRKDCISNGKYCLVPPIGHKDQISLYYNLKQGENMNVAFLEESLR